MFTGIIEGQGLVQESKTEESGARLWMRTPFRDLVLGESVAVNGVCLTVTESTPSGEALFFVSHETLRRTNLGMLHPAVPVNLERALRSGARLSGHWVQGHVDGLARVHSIQNEGESRNLRFQLARDLGRYCVEKGSIALNGVSLTLSSVQDASAEETLVGVHLIPYTWEHTNLSRVAPGDPVNVEVDVLAKYVERLCQPYPKPSKT